MKDTIWKRIIAVFAALLVGIGIASVVKDLTTMAVGEDVSADILQAREELAFEEANFRSQRLLNDRLEARKKLLLHSLSEQGVMSDIIALRALPT